jgi:pimeloyl-ACP methyl ester carboxylesterase
MVNSLVNQLLFKPPKLHKYEFSNPIIHLETATGHTICATHVERKGAHVTILFSHGNAEDLNTSIMWMRRLSRDLKVNMISYDYPGYGESEGIPSEENCYASIDAVFEYLTKERGISPHQICLYGRSLGSGPSCYLAEKTSKTNRPIAGLILHSPFSSVYRVVVDFGFTMVGDQFPNIDRIGNIRCPVFIVHGMEDTVVPFEHGQYLQEAVAQEFQTKPFWVEGMGHNHYSRQVGCELMMRINKFLDFHILARRLWMLPSSEEDDYTPRPRRLLRV